MSTLVVYASKHGATQGIAERIAAKLGEAGQEAQARPAEAAARLIGYDAFVAGSAVYAAHWQKEASAFVRRNRTVLASRPVWLFSSGPLGTEAADAKGRDLTVAAEPRRSPSSRVPSGPRAIASSSEPWTRARPGSLNGRSGSCQPPARCSPRATSATGPRSTPGRAASPTRWRSEQETSFASPRTAGAVEEGHDAPPGLLRRGRVAGERNAPRS